MIGGRFVPELKITFCFWLVELLKKLSPNDFADTNADCKKMRSIKNVKKRRVIFTASDYHKNKYEESTLNCATKLPGNCKTAVTHFFYFADDVDV